MSRMLHGALGALSAVLLVSASALAAPEPTAGDDADFIGPPPPPTAAPLVPVATVAPPPVAAAPTPLPQSGSSASPAPAVWLRQGARQAPQKLETKAPMSPLRVVAMLALLAVLGGGAYYVRRRRPAAPAGIASEKLKVLGSTRVGPKAFAVVAEVGGKRLLLGVTDQSVNTLAWLDEGAALDDERSDASRPSRPAPIQRDAEDAVPGPSGFLRVLRKAVGSVEVRPVAADEVAMTTRDEVTLSRRSRVEADELEGQVRGLARRRRDPS